jgi:alpha-1,2-mannosyltransferase
MTSNAATIGSSLGRLAADRPLLVALAALNAIFGLVAAWILFPLTFGSDAAIYRNGALGIPQGVIAEDFLYPPLTGILLTPLTWLSVPGASLAMSLVGLAVLVVGVAIETDRLELVDRALILVAALGFLPVTYELITGQVTMLIAAAVWAVRDRDGLARGIGVGLVLGLFAKPMLLPLLVWMLVRRRRALAAALITAAAVTVAGVALLGPDIYRAWIDALVGTGQIIRPGNLALTAVGDPVLFVPLAVIAAVIALWAIVTDERRGFVACLTAAMLVAPFTLMYQVSILLVAVRPALGVAPRATRVLALIANPAVLVAFSAWAGAGLVSLLPWRRRATA